MTEIGGTKYGGSEPGCAGRVVGRTIIHSGLPKWSRISIGGWLFKLGKEIPIFPAWRSNSPC
jgi:hypothetical protein